MTLVFFSKRSEPLRSQLRVAQTVSASGYPVLLRRRPNDSSPRDPLFADCATGASRAVAHPASTSGTGTKRPISQVSRVARRHRGFPRARAGRGERECPRFPSRVALRAKPWVGERSSSRASSHWSDAPRRKPRLRTSERRAAPWPLPSNSSGRGRDHSRRPPHHRSAVPHTAVLVYWTKRPSEVGSASIRFLFVRPALCLHGVRR